MKHDEYKGKRILITGGLGFIGSNLAHEITKLDCEVTIVDSLVSSCGGMITNSDGIKDRIIIEKIDLRDEKINDVVKDKDFIFNLAGHTNHLGSMQNPLEDTGINVVSQISLLEACRKNNDNAKIIFTGTRGQYGKAVYIPVDEKHPLNPTDINGINKNAAEQFHIMYHENYGMKTVCFRLTNTFGPRQRLKNPNQGFLGWFIRLAIEGKDITVYGDGKQLRDFIYVKDVCDAMLLSMLEKKTDGEVFNLASGKPVSIIKSAETVIRLAKSGSLKSAPFPQNKNKIEVGNFSSDITKLRNALGWEPNISFEDGIKLTLDFYRKNKLKYF